MKTGKPRHRGGLLRNWPAIAGVVSMAPACSALSGFPASGGAGGVSPISKTLGTALASSQASAMPPISPGEAAAAPGNSPVAIATPHPPPKSGNIAQFVALSSGSFIMGSPVDELGRFHDEEAHPVTLTRGFYLQSTEVTQYQWGALMGNNPSQFQACGGDCPVEMVTWWDTVAFANARSAAEGLTPCYTLVDCTGTPGQRLKCEDVKVNAPGGNPYHCVGYRLPTEAEWEYAYRAGTTTAFYSGGISVTNCKVDPVLDGIGWYCGNSGFKANVAASKKPNAWGLYDMAGSVAEWGWDWFAPYPTGAQVDPTGPELALCRVSRSGSYGDVAEWTRAARRFLFYQHSGYSYVGFRLARSLPRQP